MMAKGEYVPRAGGSSSEGEASTTLSRNNEENLYILIYLYGNNTAMWQNVASP
jgi:hypothetical protein